MRYFLVVGLLSLLAAPVFAADPHPFTARDLNEMVRISDPQPDPRGERIAYVLRSTDFEANRGRTDIWMVGIDGGEPVRLTSDPASDTEPRWAPSGNSLYFLSTRSGSSQVWRLPVGAGVSGDPFQVTDLPLDVANLKVSPDGTRLAFSLEVFVDCPTLACTKERLDAAAKGPATGRLYDGDVGFFRHWDTWSDGRRSHVFVMSVEGGQPLDLMKGLDADSPSKPFGGGEEYAFSPDGKALVFTAREAGREESWSTDFDLYGVPVDGSRPPANLTDANPAWDSTPAFSPDGKILAYLAMARAGYEADRFAIKLRDLASGKERTLAPDWDRSPGDLLFSADGKTLYVTTGDLGQVPLFALDVASGKVTKLVGDGHVRGPALGAGGRLVFGRDDLRSPVELYSVRADGSGLSQITYVNRERLANVLFGEPEQVSFVGAEGDTVYGWLVKPVGWERTKRYPLAFLVHGGPQGSFSNDFHYRWNPQVYAGAGYAAVMIDFHGSTGYGQAFTDSIRRDWGGKPLVDLQLGFDYVTARYAWIDGQRSCALGASYGGFMINWIAGLWPEGFRCLVNHDGIFDQRTMYYGTEELWFPEWEQGGPYWQAHEAHEKWNPAGYVDRWKTPMLVIHGGLDYRVPDLQGISTFNALKRRGIPSRFLYFPDENHWVLKPHNSLQWHDTVLGWLDQWLRKDIPAGN